MANQSGVAIYIKAFLPTGKTVEEQFDALTLIKEAKTTGKFDGVLAKSLDIEVKTEAKNRRTVDAPAAPAGENPDYQRGFNDAKGGIDTISAADSNIEAYNHGYAAGLAERAPAGDGEQQQGDPPSENLVGDDLANGKGFGGKKKEAA